MGNTLSVPVLMISGPSAHRSQALVLGADPESNAITTLGGDLASLPKVSKNTPCILVAERARWLRTPDLVDICISRFEWWPTDAVSWPPFKGHLFIPTRLRIAGLDRCRYLPPPAVFLQGGGKYRAPVEVCHLQTRRN